MERYYRRKEQGLCTNCGQPLDRDGSLCQSCREKKTQYGNETRHFLQSIGLCPRCGKEEIYGDEKMCQFCKIKMTEYNRIYIASRRKHTMQVHNDYARKRYAEHSAKGICTRCGKRKADKGFKQCGICREKQKEQRRKKREKDGIGQKRKEWIEKGLCFFCGKPVKEGYQTCEEHYQMCVEHATCENANKARQELIKQGILY